MTSPAYRACVARLEKVLSPRVASRTLRMGMQERGVDPATATAAELEPVLKGAVFKQLQVAVPVAKAREAVGSILAAMQEAEGSEERVSDDPSAATGPADGSSTRTDAAAPPADAEVPDAASSATPEPARDDADEDSGDVDALERVADLRERMRPYNLYFEWPEVRRLRAQLQRLEDGARESGDTAALAQEAEEGLALVAAKLEDMLVLQAKDLAELEETLEEVAPLGGVKVRRLEALVKHVREAQASRQLADAEIERSRRLAHELRKLMASSVFQEEERDATRSDTLRSRLEALDLAGERQDLARLTRVHGVLLEHDAALAARVREAGELAARGRPLGERLARLKEELPRAETTRRSEVEDELAAATARVATLPSDASADLERELEVLRAVLETGLPPVADLVRFRDLLGLAVDRADEAARHADADERVRREDEARTATRARDLERLHAYEREAERLQGVGGDDEASLQEALTRAREAIATGAAAEPLDEAGERIERLAATLRHRIRDMTPRLDAALGTFRTVERLNSDEVAAARRILAHLDTQREAFDRISLGMRARLEASLREAEGLLETLVEEERATRAIADQLMSGALDDMFGLFGGDERPSATDAPPPPAGPASESATTDAAEAWVRRQGGRDGVAAAALLTRGASEPLAAHRVAPPSLANLPATSDRLLAVLDDLGGALGLGTARLVTLEGARGALVLGAEADRGSAVALLAADDAAAAGLASRDLRDGAWADAAAARRRADAG